MMETAEPWNARSSGKPGGAHRLPKYPLSIYSQRCLQAADARAEKGGSQVQKYPRKVLEYFLIPDMGSPRYN